MNQVRAALMKTAETEDSVFLIDLDIPGHPSATNDAEAICHAYGSEGKRIIYRDSEGNWDEMVHDNGVFNHFTRYHGKFPPFTITHCPCDTTQPAQGWSGYE